MAKTAKKLTKKMLETLDRGELRKIAILGMSMPPADAYKRDMKGLVDWVFSHPDKFAEVDLSSVGSEHFRDGVADYVIGLQGFVLGNNTAPSWPPMELLKGVPEPVSDVIREVLAPEPEDATDCVASAYVVPTPVEKAPVVKKAPGRKVKVTLKKKKLGKKAAKEDEEIPAADADSVAEIYKKISELYETVSNVLLAVTTNNVAGLSQTVFDVAEIVEATNKDVQAVRQEMADSQRLLSNAILYLLNSVVQDEGEEFRDIANVPAPEDYLEPEDD